ncbi:hypothetical protein [Lentzea terrae]|uniref:hypothetical protein n=1 Tax=Lentzea terrae TaxID=2200761 RepID=UPI000DD2E7F3|nr:hypothetical protein [Lentzea terrae]
MSWDVAHPDVAEEQARAAHTYRSVIDHPSLQARHVPYKSPSRSGPAVHATPKPSRRQLAIEAARLGDQVEDFTTLAHARSSARPAIDPSDH